MTKSLMEEFGPRRIYSCYVIGLLTSNGYSEEKIAQHKDFIIDLVSSIGRLPHRFYKECIEVLNELHAIEMRIAPEKRCEEYGYDNKDTPIPEIIVKNINGEDIFVGEINYKEKHHDSKD